MRKAISHAPDTTGEREIVASAWVRRPRGQSAQPLASFTITTKLRQKQANSQPGCRQRGHHFLTASLGGGGNCRDFASLRTGSRSAHPSAKPRLTPNSNIQHNRRIEVPPFKSA